MGSASGSLVPARWESGDAVIDGAGGHSRFSLFACLVDSPFRAYVARPACLHGLFETAGRVWLLVNDVACGVDGLLLRLVILSRMGCLPCRLSLCRQARLGFRLHSCYSLRCSS